ncbi:E3 ubiquitin-protein ligase upl4 [Datura stramonium]|uniref:E3 ubiquitin-protein ligase upl4 n=1 Tax=Datura stramonium TaxID=4076 RepID=A0ABS8V2Y1_DATST|nr:E3 ubiquitin-protein ligase upl4 [Datura stramonium]
MTSHMGCNLPTLMVDGQHYNQVDEVLKLLNELLPPISREQNIQLAADKEQFLINHPDLLQKFGFDLLPVLIQVVNSGVNLYACYGCLSVINKLVYFSKSDMLGFLQNTNISSFLAGVFTVKDPHVLILALQIVDKLLEALSFSSGVQASDETCQGSVPRAAVKCLCFAYDATQSPTGQEARTCKIEKETVESLARHIRTNYFAADSMNPDLGITDVLQKQRLFLLRQKVDGDDSVNQLYIVEKRFELFGRLLLYNSVPPLEDSAFLALIRRLHSALCSVENFPVILSHGSKPRNSYATIPYGHCLTYPCPEKVAPGPMELDTTSTDTHETQEVKDNLQLFAEMETVAVEQTKSDSMDTSDVNAESLKKGRLNPSEDDSSTSLECTGCCDDEDVAPKLIFYLEGRS